MDIERLKEIRKRLEYNSEFEDEEIENLWELIDEAIARQSVTSEEVTEAIQTLKNIYPSPRQIAMGEYPHVAEAIDLAITALQAYQPWISVSERLPDGDVASVLIYTKEGGVAEGQYYQSISAWKQFRWSVEDSSVTHWKPLPELPKGETE